MRAPALRSRRAAVKNGTSCATPLADLCPVRNACPCRTATAKTLPNTTVVTKWHEARSLVFGSDRTVRGIDAVFANQTKAEDAPDYASLATATGRADGGFRVR